MRRHVRRVVLITSSSRGGSSIFAEMLRQRRDLLHLRAELNPFLALSGLSWGQPGMPDSDSLDPSLLDGPGGEARAQQLDRWLAAECGRPKTTLTDPELPSYGAQLALRLNLQWPGEAIHPEEVTAHVRKVLSALRAPGDESFPDIHTFFAELLVRLRVDHPVIHPGWYDLDRGVVARVWPGLPPPEGPPPDSSVEEPPFVLVHPWESATAADLERLPLVIKTPSNAYRLPFLRRFFAGARVDVLHLTRNAAASINGLYDGWRFYGFYAHHVGEPLRVAGYTDHRPQDAGWWKFDLPPGWRAWRERPLEELCAFQWRSAHAAALDDQERAPNLDRFSLAFEDVLAGRLDRVDAWLGHERTPRPDELPPVMATAPPRQRRWFQRAGLLQRVLADPATTLLMARLGYPAEPELWL